MRHRKAFPRLGRTSTHRKAMFRNMVTSLFREERVETTVPKAKEARRIAERVITHAKRGGLHARRQAARVVQDQVVLQKLFDDIGPRFTDRPGGYTRILKTGFRSGDNAAMSILELLPASGETAYVEQEPEEKDKKVKGRKKTSEKAGKGASQKSAGKAAKKASAKKAKKKTTAQRRGRSRS